MTGKSVVGKRKSVAIIGTRGYPSYYGGFETAVRKLAPYLADEGWDVTVYGRKGSTRPNDPDVDGRVSTVVTPGLESKSLSTLSHGLTACLHAARRKPDVVLVMNVANGYWLPLLRLRGIPTLVNVDGIEWDRAKWGRTAKRVFRFGATLTARFARGLVYDSREIGKRWMNEFGREGHFIPYGGDASSPLPVEDGLTRRGYVLLVARFVPENTIHEFVSAAETLANRWPIVIVGSSGYGDEIEMRVKRLVESHPNVKWLGHVSDDSRLQSLWQHAGAYFHGHSVGGTNPALVQAMMCGAPVVARDTIYNREVLGDAGRLVRPEAQAIIDAISEVMGDGELQDDLGNAGNARATVHYTWKGVCSKYEKALDGLAAS